MKLEDLLEDKLEQKVPAKVDAKLRAKLEARLSRLLKEFSAQSDGTKERAVQYAALNLANREAQELHAVLDFVPDLLAPNARGEVVLTRALALGLSGVAHAVLQGLQRSGGVARALQRPSRDGWPPLHLAARECMPAVVEAVLDGGADLEARHRGLTALHCAAGCHNESVARLLVNRGASATAVDSDFGWTPLHLAVAAALPGPALVELLVGSRCDIDAVDQSRRTPLLVATEFAPANVPILLGAGASVEACDDAGRTALHIAAQERHVGAVRELLSAGCPTEARDSAGQVALWYADDAVAAVLTEADQPLWRAVTCDDAAESAEELAEVLRGGACDVNVIDRHGVTPLLLACIQGRHAVVQQLLEVCVGGSGVWCLVSAVPGTDSTGRTGYGCPGRAGLDGATPRWAQRPSRRSRLPHPRPHPRLVVPPRHRGREPGARWGFRGQTGNAGVSHARRRCWGLLHPSVNLRRP